MRVLLVSTYELGHQPLHLAAPGRRPRPRRARGAHRSTCRSSRGPGRRSTGPTAVAFSVPMHTAMRLAAPGRRRGAAAPAGPADLPLRPLRHRRPGPDPGPAGWSTAPSPASTSRRWWPGPATWPAGAAPAATPPAPTAGVVDLGRHKPAAPPGPLRLPAARPLRPARRSAASSGWSGYVEASHGCVHRCRHCPVPVVYDGRIRIGGRRRGARRRRAAGRGRRPPHHLRRPRLPQRAAALPPGRRRRARPPSRSSPSTARSRSSTSCATPTCGRSGPPPAACSWSPPSRA